MNREIQKASESIAWLRSRILSPELAVRRVGRVAHAADLLQLFEHYFREEFAALPALRLTDDDSLKRLNYAFLDLVYRRLFPVPDYFLEEMFDEEGEMCLTCGSIPLWPLVDEYWNGDPQYLRLVFRLILVLDGTLDDDVSGSELLKELNPTLRAMVRVRAWDHKSAGPFEVEALRSACARERSPLKRLITAWEVVHHDSANLWISLTTDNCGFGEMPEWSRENIDWVASHYKQAEEMLDAVVLLDDWLQEDHGRINRLVRFWNKAKGRQRVRVRVGQPLVEIMA